MIEKRFTITQNGDNFTVRDNLKKRHMGMFEFKQDEFPVYYCFHKIIDLLNEQYEEIQQLQRHLDVMRSGALTDDKRIKELYEENEELKAQLYCDDEEGICNICKHHYLVKDDEAELGYYNSRCRKGHYECARISLKYCDDFEKGDVE